MTELAIGIDLGATKIAGALVQGDVASGQIQVRQARAVPTETGRGAEAVLDRIAALILSLVGDAAQLSLPLRGVGIGTPGQVDPASGTVRAAVNLDWENVALLEALQARGVSASLPLWLAKDVQAGALGELYFGAGRGLDNFVYLSIGSGLGGGVVAGGKLLLGAAGNAGEVGHLVLDPAGIWCACGRRGCAETIVSGPGLVRLVQASVRALENAAAAPAPPPSELLSLSPVTSEAVVAAAGRGDEFAQSALRLLGHNLGLVMAACTAVVDPARFVIGGGLGRAAFRWLAPAAANTLANRAWLVPDAAPDIVPSEQSSPAVGAASLVWHYGRQDSPGTNG